MNNQLHIPGGKWIYFKFYTGTKTADELLVKYIHPFVTKLLKKKYIESYFFIRYSDPDFHIRLRILLHNKSFYNDIFESFYKHFNKIVQNSIVWKIQIDTYMPEYNRYGKNSIEFCEKIFAIDSSSILNLIKMLDSDEKRWLTGLLLVDDILSPLYPSYEEKISFMSKLRNSFCKEHGIITQKYLKPLNLKFKENKSVIEQAFNNRISPQIKTILLKRKKEISKTLYEIVDNKLDIDNILDKSIIPSLIHMSMNRLFRKDNRLCETVIYYLITEYYMYVVARKKYDRAFK